MRKYSNIIISTWTFKFFSTTIFGLWTKKKKDWDAVFGEIKANPPRKRFTFQISLVFLLLLFQMPAYIISKHGYFVYVWIVLKMVNIQLWLLQLLTCVDCVDIFTFCIFFYLSLSLFFSEYIYTYKYIPCFHYTIFYKNLQSFFFSFNLILSNVDANWSPIYHLLVLFSCFHFCFIIHICLCLSIFGVF